MGSRGEDLHRVADVETHRTQRDGRACIPGSWKRVLSRCNAVRQDCFPLVSLSVCLILSLSLVSVLVLKSGCLTAPELQCVLVHTLAEAIYLDDGGGGVALILHLNPRPLSVQPSPAQQLGNQGMTWTMPCMQRSFNRLTKVTLGFFINTAMDRPKSKTRSTLVVWMKTAPIDS